MLSFFAACAPGLEPLLAAEVDQRLGCRGRPVPGGVELEGDFETLARAHLELGLALKILVRVGEFSARSFADLEKRSGRVDWNRWIPPKATVRPRVKCVKSRLYHSGAVAERIAGVIDSGDGEPTIDVHARIERDRCTLSIDVSGEPLHKRGYRALTGAAPLREDLARGLLLLSGWDRRSTLVDPFCGSGTILIEAHLLAAGLAPGAGRSFLLEQLPLSEPEVWHRLRACSSPASAVPTLFGSDRDSRAIDIARTCAERAGAALELSVSDARTAPLWQQAPGFVATNPPYGRRVSGAGGALAILAEKLSEHRGGVALVLPARFKPPRGIGLRPLLTTDHGGQKVAFWAR